MTDVVDSWRTHRSIYKNTQAKTPSHRRRTFVGDPLLPHRGGFDILARKPHGTQGARERQRVLVVAKRSVWVVGLAVGLARTRDGALRSPRRGLRTDPRVGWSRSSLLAASSRPRWPRQTGRSGLRRHATVIRQDLDAVRPTRHLTPPAVKRVAGWVSGIEGQRVGREARRVRHRVGPRDVAVEAHVDDRDTDAVPNRCLNPTT